MVIHIIILFFSILVASFTWRLVYNNNTQFRRIVDIFYHKIIRFLSKRYSRTLTEVLVHGAFHFVILITTGILIYSLYVRSISMNSPDPNNISLTLTRKSLIKESPKSVVKNINIKFIFDSDSLYKESGNKGKSGIEVSYQTKENDSVDIGLVYTEWDKEGKISVFGDTTEYINPHYTVLHGSTKNAIIRFDPAVDRNNGFHDGSKITIVNDSFNKSLNNPYYYFNVSLNLAEAKVGYREAFINDWGYTIDVQFQFGDQESKDTINIEGRKIPVGNDSKFNKNLKITYINPTPDGINKGVIKYSSKASIERLLSEGNITIQAEDIEQIKKNDQESLLFTILLGMFGGFLLDVIVQLIRELRNLNRKRSEEKKTKKPIIFLPVQNSQNSHDN